MARVRRMLREDEPTVYHVISRVALEGLPFGDEDRDYLLGLIRHWSGIYAVDVLGFAIMGNHFHLVVRMYPGEQLTDEEVERRYRIMSGAGDDGGPVLSLTEEEVERLRKRLSSLSWYVKDIKQGFSRYFNKRRGRRGFLWGERFKSLIVEEGDTLLNLLAYVDLNPVRAGIVQRPEEYRWCSLGYYVQTGNKGNLLSLDFGVKAWCDCYDREVLRRYREFVYEVSGIRPGKRGIDASILKKERERGYSMPALEVFRYRCRYFSDGCVLGSRRFVDAAADRFRDLFGWKRRRKGFRFLPVSEIYSLRRLRAVG